MTLSRQEVKRRKKYKKWRKHRNRHPKDNSPINVAKKLVDTMSSFNPMAQPVEAVDGADWYNKMKEKEKFNKISTTEHIKKEEDVKKNGKN